MKKRTFAVLATFVMILLLGFLSARTVRADGGSLDIAAVTSNSVTIRWEKPSYTLENAQVIVTGYKVLYGTSADQLKQFGKKLSASATKKKVTGLSPKKKYYFQVKVLVDIVNESAGIKDTDATDYMPSPVTAITLPGKIKTLRVTSADIENEQVVFKWKAVNPNYKNFGYQYYIKTVSGKKKASAKVTKNGVRLNKITNTGCYFGRVRSYCRLENREGVKYFYGEWSEWVPILSDPLLVAVALPEGKLNVTWSEMKGVDGYDIYVFKKGWKKFYKAVYTATGPTSGTILKLNGKSFTPARNTSYEVTVVARKNYGGKNYYSLGYVSQSVNVG